MSVAWNVVVSIFKVLTLNKSIRCFQNISVLDKQDDNGYIFWQIISLFHILFHIYWRMEASSSVSIQE